MKSIVFALAICVPVCASAANSPTFTTLVQFTGSGGTASGQRPYGSLTLSGSKLYGVTYTGGAYNAGNVFGVDIDGTHFQSLLSFTGSAGSAIGAAPYGSLTLSGSTLYGMTEFGGVPSFGNIFRVGSDGANYQNMGSFTGTGGTASGKYPYGSLTLSATALYGMTYGGGAGGLGNVFRLGSDGTSYQNLVSFTGTGGTASGSNPYGSLTLSGSTLYGMTPFGGADGAGTIFRMGSDGTSLQNLISFTGSSGTASGQYPFGSLIVSGSTLYGMTQRGGAASLGNVFRVDADGTYYQTLLSFTGTGGAASGWYPDGSLILSGTTLYGTTLEGGVGGVGNVFSVGVDGSGYQNLYSFSGGADGARPYGDLTLSGGTLFGMTNIGGIGNNGTIFALALPTIVPEPGTLALVGSGAAALVTYRWRRRRERW